MKKQMIIAGLKARPVRTTVSILAVALEVTLILVIIGLTTGMAEETATRTAGLGGEIMVLPQGASMIVAFTSNTMHLSIAGKLAELPNVQAVTPVHVQLNSQKSIEIIYGIDLASFNAVSGGFRWIEGGLFKAPDEIVVDEIWAKAHNNAKPGDQVELLNHKLRISGIAEHGLGARVFMSMEGVEQLTGEPVRAGLFYVKLKDPGKVETAIADIKNLLPDNKVYGTQEYISLMTSGNLPGFPEFIDAVVFLALAIGVLVIFLSMYTTITERTREIGILRSLGATKAFIVSLILQESLFVCLLGVVFGVGFSYFVREMVPHVFPTQQVLVTLHWIGIASASAVLSGIIGSIYPSLKAAAQDPVEALAYE